MLTEPESNASRPLRQRRKVDLPEPDGPITTSTSPFATCVDTLSTARTTWPRVSKTFTRSRTSITLREPPLKPAGYFRQRQVDQQVQPGHAEQDFERRERGGYDFTTAFQQFGNGDHRHQRGVFYQADELPGQRRQYAFQCLWQHHMTHRLTSTQTEGARCFILTTGDRLHAGADDLGHIGAGEQRQRGDPGEFPGQVHHGADEEVENEDLHQQWRAAYQFDINGREIAQGRVAGQAAQAGGKTDQQAEYAGHHGKPQGGPE